MADQMLHDLLDSLDLGIPMTVTLTDDSVISPAIVVRIDLYSVTNEHTKKDDWPRAGGFVTLNNEPYLISDIKAVERS